MIDYNEAQERAADFVKKWESGMLNKDLKHCIAQLIIGIAIELKAESDNAAITRRKGNRK